MRAAAEILDIGRIGRGGAGLLGVGPGLLVGVLARLLVRRLLLLCLLRIRGLAASRRQGGAANDDCNDRQFRKWDASSAPELLTTIISHGWPFPGLRASTFPLSTPVSSSICHISDHWHSRLLRASRGRPGHHRAAEQRDELAAFHCPGT